ncbi:hypothetical protein NCC49_000653 [Naganishia albida]|nr:hypothetical protein NCC49_000653 [Naganishia albida]
MSFITPRTLFAAVSRTLRPSARTFTTTTRWQNASSSSSSPSPVSSIPSLSSFAGATPLGTDKLSSAQADIASSFLRDNLPGLGDSTSSSLDAPTTPEGWWRETYGSRTWSKPGNQYTGRSINVPSKSGEAGVATAIRRLNGVLMRNRVKRELRLGEYYEKPSERKKRLAVERHRRRFQDLVRQKVQLVQTIRNRS